MRSPAVFYSAFVVVAATIIAIGFLSYRRYVRNFELEVSRELTSISELKAEQLVQWRKERLLDTAGLDQNIFISVLVERSIKAPTDSGTQRRLQAWLQKYCDSGIYDRIQVLDRQGTVKLALPDGISPTPPAVLQRLSAVLQTGRAEIVDFYLDPIELRPFLILLIPVFTGGSRSSVEGVLSLRIDPEVYLYPLIKQWPRPSQTAETLLVRRDGEDVLFLNELRFQKNAALNLRIPIREQTIAGRAVGGWEGIVKGLDYRRKTVIANLRRIPDSPWFLIARMDRSEVYPPIRMRL